MPKKKLDRIIYRVDGGRLQILIGVGIKPQGNFKATTAYVDAEEVFNDIINQLSTREMKYGPQPERK